MIFSVVIPVYNVKDYLPKCIDSVLAQDFEDYEVILIDDGSTPSTSRTAVWARRATSALRLHRASI